MSKINKTKIANSITYSAYGLGILLVFALSVFATILIFVPRPANAEGGTNYVYSSGTTGNGLYYGPSGSSNYNYNPANLNPVPMIYIISPNSVPSLNGNIVITLTGDNFIPNSLAEFNNTYRPTNFRDSSHLTVTLNASDLSTIGSYIITVFNPMPGGGHSNGVTFTVNSGILNNNVSSATPVARTYSSSASTTTVKAPAESATGATENTTTESYSALASNALFGINTFLPSSLIQWLMLAILILLIFILVRKIYGEKQYLATPLKHQ